VPLVEAEQEVEQTIAEFFARAARRTEAIKNRKAAEREAAGKSTDDDETFIPF
jgi:hypothetical protein